MAKVIAFANHKGGVGKTMATLNFSAALARIQPQAKILLLDVDPQANLSMVLNAMPDHEQLIASNNVYMAITGKAKAKPIPLNENMHIIPSTLDMTAGEYELSGVAFREQFLSEMLMPFQDQYDYIIIDTPPSLGLYTINAMVVADDILIPVGADLYSIKGINTLYDAYERVKKYSNKNLRIAGIFINIASVNTQMHEVTVEWMRENYPDHFMDSFVRKNVDVSKAVAANQDIFSYNESCNAAIDYMALAKEYLQR